MRKNKMVPTCLGLEGALDMKDPKVVLLVEAAMVWIESHTNFIFGAEQPVPANVRLFILKFCEVMECTPGVASESIAGISQSFFEGGNGQVLKEYAAELLSEWYKNGAFLPAKKRWFG